MEHEVTRHAQRPVLATEAVPVESIKLGTETATETVGGDVRTEQIKFDAAEEITDHRTNRS